MHFVHITPEQIKEHPWLGVLIGLIGVALCTFISYIAVRDYINFSKQKSPELIDVEKLEPAPSFIRKWVTLTNFRLDCEMVEQIKRTNPVEKLVEGPVYDTYMIITNSFDEELIVAIFHGDRTCSNFQNQPLTGILTTSHDYSYGLGYLSTRLSKTTTASLMLHVDEGLGQPKIALAVGIFFTIVFLSFLIKSIRMWLEKWESKTE